MTREILKAIAEQVLGGKKLHQIDFGEPNLSLEEKLARIENALKHYPAADQISLPEQVLEQAADN
jgi:hypothetical protein